MKIDFTGEEIQLLKLLLSGLVEEPWASIRKKLEGEEIR